MIDLNFYTSKLQKKVFSIFLFHGVINDISDGIRNYTKKHLFKKDFENLLIRLKKKGKPISIDEVINFHEKNIPFPDFSFAITFDDGFENNYSVAKPILEDLSIPATFYISTNLVDKNLMTWIDQIEFCINKVDQEKVYLPWSSFPYEISSRKTKIELLESVRKNVKRNPINYSTKNIVKYIFKQCKMQIKRSGEGPLDKKMNWNQVQNLHNHKLFSIGGHSHNHVSLGSLKLNEMQIEINKSFTYLKQEADISTCHYSYPEGRQIDYNENVKNILKNYGIKCCPTAIVGENANIVKSLFDLKRILVV